MNFIILLLCFMIIFSEDGFKFVSTVRLYEKNNTDSYLNSLQIIEKNGYPAESHLTVTEDGYILELHRIPHGKNLNSKRKRIPIYFQHGLLGSSVDFLLIGPGKALPYLLADKGYDVWLGNIRGNTYSRAHKTLTPSDRQFWDFSWHESGVYDLPAQIDYICNYTKQNELFYIGYSMGTTMFFVMASSRPEYQEKVRGAILMAPVAYLKNVRTPLRFLAPLAYDFQIVAEFLTDGELNPQSTLYRYLVRITCTLNKLERDLCRNLIFLYAGCDPFQFNEDILPSLLNHVPAGTSAKTITHFAQLIQSGKFQQFDYGPKQNIIKYNSTTPIQYNVEAITTPLYLYQGENDFLSTIPDVRRLLKRLPNVRNLDISDYDHFNHLDFVIANDVKTLLYDKLMKQMENFLAETEYRGEEKGEEDERFVENGQRTYEDDGRFIKEGGNTFEDERRIYEDDERTFGNDERTFAHGGRIFGDGRKAFEDEGRIFKHGERTFGDGGKISGERGKAFEDEERTFGNDERTFAHGGRIFGDGGKAFEDGERKYADGGRIFEYGERTYEDREKAFGDDGRTYEELGNIFGNEEEAFREKNRETEAQGEVFEGEGEFYDFIFDDGIFY